MSNRQFDDELRERLKNYAPELDKQAFWQQLEKKQTKNYWPIVMLLILAVGSGAAFLIGNNLNQNSMEITSTIDKNRSKTKAKNNSIELLEKATNQNQENRIDDKTLHSTITKSEELFANTNKNIVVNNEESVQNKNNSLKRNKEQNRSTVNETGFAIYKEETAKKSINQAVVDAKLSASELNETGLTSKIEIGNIESQLYEPVDKYPMSDSKEVTVAPNKNLSPSFDKNLNGNETAQISNPSTIALKLPEFAKQQMATRNGEAVVANWIEPEGELEKRKPTKKRILPKNNQRKTFELKLEGIVSPMFPLKSLKDNSGENDNYLAQRQFSEQALRGYQMEVNVIGEFKKHAYFKVGLSYAGFKESFIYKKETTREYYEQGLSSIDIGPSGDTTFTIDSVLVTELVKRNINRINSYHMLDVSASMGAIFAQKKWAVFADAGLAYNMLFSNNGQQVNENYEPIYFNESLENGSPIFRRNLGLAGIASIGFAYEIRKDLSFKIQAGYKRYFNSFSAAQNPISQQYQFINLGMGLQYTFNNF